MLPPGVPVVNGTGSVDHYIEKEETKGGIGALQAAALTLSHWASAVVLGLNSAIGGRKGIIEASDKHVRDA